MGEGSGSGANFVEAILPAQRRTQNLRSYSWSLLLWLVVGTLVSLLVDLSYPDVSGITDPAYWGRQAAFWLTFTPLTPLLFALAGSVWLQAGSWRRDALRVFLFGALFLLAHEIAVGSIHYVAGRFDPREPGGHWYQWVFFAIESVWLLDLLVYSVSFFVFLGIAKSLRLREREFETTRLRESLTESRLTALQDQLQPHFLFNTLHTIGVFAKRDPDESRRMITLLGDVLRASLETGRPQEIALRDELAMLEKFLEIERIRFRDRMRVEVDVGDSALDCAVPHFLLQPLVENAIRHGIEGKAGEGRLHISGIADAEWLRISVADNGDARLAESPRERVGLGNTRERLRLLYGEEQELRLRRSDAGGVETHVRIPRRRLA